MSEADNIEDLTGYVPIKDAARRLGISVRRLYGHVEKGRIRAVRFANTLGIPEEALKDFRYGISGRQRKNTPVWRRAAAKSVWLQIFVQLRSAQENMLEKRLDKMRVQSSHTFPGTAARYIVRSDQRPDEVQILLIWRGSLIPTEEAREEALEGLRRELADIVDWSTARYETGQVLMHT